MYYKASLFISSLLCFHSVASAEDPIEHADQITYDWLLHLGDTTGYTDHISIFKEIFQSVKINNLVEFGLGFSTKYFLDSCKKVVSVEFITNGFSPDWARNCLSLFQNIPNWVPIIYFSGYQQDTQWAPYRYCGSDEVYKACVYQTVTHGNYALFDPTYLSDLTNFIQYLTDCYPIDLGFVDSGLYLRGDLVQLLFNKTPIIVAHDTAVRSITRELDVYGYSRIVTPDTYEEIFIPLGKGTTVWVIKTDQFAPLRAQLNALANSF